MPFVPLLLMASVTFWQPIFLPSIETVSGMVLAFVLAWGFFAKPRSDMTSVFSLGLAVIYIGLVGATYSCAKYWDRTYSDSMIRIFQYEFFLGGVYCALRRYRPSIDKIERVLFVLGLITAVVFVFQLWMGQNLYFGSINDDARGVSVRLRLPGGLLFSLLLFLCINRLILKFERRYAIGAVLFAVMLLLQGFRTYLAGVVFCATIMMASLSRMNARSLLSSIVVVGMLISVILSPVGQLVLDAYVEKTQLEFDDQREGDNIRLQSFYYYSNEPRSVEQAILGSGVLTVTPSRYASHYLALEQNHGLHRVDLGLYGYYLYVGLISLIGIGIVFAQVFRAKIASEYSYLKYFYLYIMVVSITTAEFFRLGSFGIEGAVLYMIESQWWRGKYSASKINPNP